MELIDFSHSGGKFMGKEAREHKHCVERRRLCEIIVGTSIIRFFFPHFPLLSSAALSHKKYIFS